METAWHAAEARASDPAHPLDTAQMGWIPTGPGRSFRPLRFERGGWSELMRLDLGSVVPLHRHTVIEYLGEDGQVTETISTATQREVYLDWCRGTARARPGRSWADQAALARPRALVPPPDRRNGRNL